MGPRKADIWIVPVSKQTAENVWVVIAETRVKGKALRTLRVFSTEPTESLVEHFRAALGEKATALVMEVAPDYLDAEEIEDVTC